MPQINLLHVNKINIAGGTQPRAELNEDILREYGDLWKEETKFPAVTVIYDGDEHWLADGFHRVESAKRAGRDKIEATIIHGTHRDAILLSCKANSKHGLRRTNADKHRAIMRLLEDEEWSEWSDRKIAETCVVSHPLVASLRKNLTGRISSDTMKPQQNQGGDSRKYTDKHGQDRSMKVGNISAANTARATNGKPPYVLQNETPPRPGGTAAGEGAQETSSPPAPALKDQLGREVPERLRPIFDLLTEPIKAMRQKIMDAEKVWTAVESQVLSTEGLKWVSGFSGFLDLHNLMDDLKSIAHRLKSALPFTLCSYCKGQDPSCRACRGTAVITEQIFKSAPAELRLDGSPTLAEINRRDGIETRRHAYCDEVSFEFETEKGSGT